MHESLVSNIVSLESRLCNLNSFGRNKLMESDFSFLNWFILSLPATKSSTYKSLLFLFLLDS